METTRLRLRCARADDAPALADMMTDPVSRRLATWPVPYTLAMAERRIADSRHLMAARRLLPLVVEHRAAGCLMGWISAARAEGERHAMLTYWLGERYHHQGIMREAAPLALAAAFRALDVAALRAAVQPDDAASLAVLRVLGAAPLGTGLIHVPARSRDEDCLYREIVPGQRPPVHGAHAIGAEALSS